MIKDGTDKDVFKLKNESNLNNKADIVSQTRKYKFTCDFDQALKTIFISKIWRDLIY